MRKGRRVAILAVRFGNGHWQAAQALKTALEEADPTIVVDVRNYLTFAGHLFELLTRVVYHDLMIRFPGIYRVFFSFTNNLHSGSFLQRLINSCGSFNFLRYLKKTAPCLIISTFPVPSAVTAELKRRGLISCPLVTVITDYTLHRQWIQPGTDLYVVATREMAEELVRFGVSPQSVAALGIPVAPGLKGRTGKGIGRLLPALPAECYGFPLVLVINGATNFRGDLPAICRMLADFPIPLVAVVLAVERPSLRIRLRRMIGKGRNPVFIMGYSRELPSFLDLATCLISKAGGMTVSEALVKEVPLIIYRPLPCQEEKNRDYLVSSGAALTAEDVEGLEECLREVLLKPHLCSRMKAAARRLRRPDAAREAARLMLTYRN